MAQRRTYGSVIISPSVDDTGFETLLKAGNLKTQDSAAYSAYCDSIEKARARILKEENVKLANSLAEIQANSARLHNQVSIYLARKRCDLYS